MTLLPQRLAVVVTILLATFPATGAAQRARLSFDRLAQDRGLSNGTVTALAQDQIGFLWLGTEDGLNRYDGAGFELYRPVDGDTTSLAHPWVTQLAVSRDGALWVGTLRGGLNRYDPHTGRFRRFGHRDGDPASLPGDQINAILEARDGAVWVGTHRGLARLDPRTGLARRFELAASDSALLANDVVAVAEGADGRIWVAARVGLFVLSPLTGRAERLDGELGTGFVRVLHRDRRGDMWIGAENELLRIDGKTGAVTARWNDAARHTPLAGRVMAITEAPDGTLWIGTDDGITALEPATGRFVRHTTDPADPRSLGGSIVRSALVDRGGVLWVGLESYGVSRHAPSAVRFDLIRHDPSSPNSLSHGYVRGIAEDRSGDIWIATQFGGLNRIDAATGRITTYRHRAGDPHSLPGDNAWAVLEDRTGTFWVGLHQQGLGTLDPVTGRFTRSRLVPGDASVNMLYESRNGTLYAGLESRGLIAIDPDRRHARLYGATVGERLLADDDVQAVLEDREGMLWVGGAGGLTRLDPRTGTARQFHGAPGRPGALQGDFVTNIVEDSRGYLWVATKGGGLSRYERATGTFTTLGTADGLPHSFVYGILEDARGRLWISTDNGIGAIEPVTLAVTRYGLEDGLQAREFNRRAHHRAADGTMYFGGINGVNVFRPDELDAPPPPPPVSILALDTESGRRLLGAHQRGVAVEVPGARRAFTVSFAAFDYTAPEKTRYFYRLDGFDAEWVDAGTRREATYAAVPPGRYVFRVTAANAAGVRNPVGDTIAIVIPRPWWDSWWIRLGAAALLLAVPVLGGRLRLRQARRRSAWLEQRVAEQTRDLTAAQVRLHEALERERAAATELLEITATVPGAVFQLREDPGGRRAFTFVSEGALRFDDAHAADARHDPRRAAMRLLTQVHPDDVEVIERAMARARAALEPWRGDLRIASGGAVRWLSVHARPFLHPDGSTVWTGVAMDTTAARRAEIERAALEAKMLNAQKAESLGVLAGGIAHDFNNLLVGMLANAELLRQELPAEGDAAATVEQIRIAATRAADLTGQMLAYAGKGRFVVERVELAGVAREMVTLLRSVIPRRVALELDAPAPAVVLADATQLRQILLNLVTNGSEAIGERTGRVAVRIRIEEARAAPPMLHASPDMPARGPYAVIEVEDTGAGMTPATLERVFDPFYTTKFTGRGLGLAAVLGIVRAHRGGIQVRTAPGEGTTFAIWFPLVEETAAPAAGDGPPAAAVAPPLRGRVLLVDDEPVVRAAADRVLRKFGYDVIVAADGAAAVAMAAAAGPVDLVLMDVTMPGLDGPAAARELRAQGVAAPIVMMSGYAEEELMARGVSCDSAGFLKKPFTVPELMRVLREAQARVTTPAL